jgi:hypothetical protein
MISEGFGVVRLGQGPIAILLWLSLQLTAPIANHAQPSAGCPWSGPSERALLAQHPPTGQVTGTLAATIVPFLRRGGIPVCLVSVRGDDEQVRLALRPGATMQDVLSEIVRQAPRYQFRGMDGKLVIYPHGEIYDLPVDLGPRQSMTRAAAYFTVLGGLRNKIKDFEGLRAGLRNEGTGWAKRSFADKIEVGGSRTVIEHLVSLVQKRPSKAFNVKVEALWLSFEFVDLELLTRLDLHVPSTVRVGEPFQVEVTGKLVDGTVVSLAGPECWVSYATSDPEALEIDDSGRALARKKGVWTVYANYQYVPDVHAEIHVE